MRRVQIISPINIKCNQRNVTFRHRIKLQIKKLKITTVYPQDADPNKVH